MSNRIEKAINKVKRLDLLLSNNKDKMKICTYKKIMEVHDNPSLLRNKDFQRMYNGYYAVRRGEQWREYYYALFADFISRYKNDEPVNFDMIIENMLDAPGGNVEISFSSKILATIDPCMPIYDSRIAQVLSIGKPSSVANKDRLQRAKRIYSDLTNEYNDYFEAKKHERVIEIFNDQIHDGTDISDAKKVDFVLWIIGG